MIGVEFVKDRKSKVPADELCAKDRGPGLRTRPDPAQLRQERHAHRPAAEHHPVRGGRRSGDLRGSHYPGGKRSEVRRRLLLTIHTPGFDSGCVFSSNDFAEHHLWSVACFSYCDIILTPIFPPVIPLFLLKKIVISLPADSFYHAAVLRQDWASSSETHAIIFQQRLAGWSVQGLWGIFGHWAPGEGRVFRGLSRFPEINANTLLVRAMRANLRRHYDGL